MTEVVGTLDELRFFRIHRQLNLAEVLLPVYNIHQDIIGAEFKSIFYPNDLHDFG